MRRAAGSEGDPSDTKVTKFNASVRIQAVTQELITTGFVSLRVSSKICPCSLFSLTPNKIACHRIFQLLDRVSFSSRQTLFTNETRPMKLVMRRARMSEEDLPLTFL
ncbi:hypothetical protein T07_9727 [Trichinella nelsoni]|uniref:Uncharacterized protein n=1 Tax=Trichinella nelsoni TaxID=6336 RepID=A0A0V0S1A6_9BILA|nr:hypothetical protein T07_9727 [Trichinella nelsoni]